MKIYKINKYDKICTENKIDFCRVLYKLHFIYLVCYTHLIRLPSEPRVMVCIADCLQLKPGQQIPSPSELMGKILIKNKKGASAPAKPPPQKKPQEESHGENAGENKHRLFHIVVTFTYHLTVT